MGFVHQVTVAEPAKQLAQIQLPIGLLETPFVPPGMERMVTTVSLTAFSGDRLREASARLAVALGTAPLPGPADPASDLHREASGADTAQRSGTTGPAKEKQRS
jgi:hypothetical protein